jgi:hypothetical protein
MELSSSYGLAVEQLRIDQLTDLSKPRDAKKVKKKGAKACSASDRNVKTFESMRIWSNNNIL